MAASGFRDRVTGLVFVFKSASLVLKHAQTAFENLRQIPLISQLSFYIIFGRFNWFQVVLCGFRSFLDRFRSF